VLREVLGKPGKADTYVIDGGTEPVNPGVISDRFVKVRGLAKVRNIGFHSFRKYYVTSLLSAGVPAHAVALTVGWKSTRMIDTYAGATKSGCCRPRSLHMSGQRSAHMSRHRLVTMAGPLVL
jgi:integrase